MSESEASIQTAILLRLGTRANVRLWRSNVGMGWVKARTAAGFRPQRFGVPGQPDLTGCIVLRGPLAVWLGVEVKSARGRQTPEQRQYQEMMTTLGGVYILTRSADDAERQLNDAISGLLTRLT